MQVLARTVVAGGVKYSAGTAATPELLELIHASHWTSNDHEDQTPAFNLQAHRLTAALAEALGEVADLKAALVAAGEQRDADTATIAEQYETIARLSGEVETLTARLAALGGTPAASAAPAAPAASATSEPPRAGRGSSEDAWREYATSLGIDVPADAGRDDIIALVDAEKTGGE